MLPAQPSPVQALKKLEVLPEALLTDFEMHPAQLPFTLLLHLHLCADCQLLNWSSWPRFAFQTLEEKEPWKYLPAPGSCLLRVAQYLQASSGLQGTTTWLQQNGKGSHHSNLSYRLLTVGQAWC